MITRPHLSASADASADTPLTGGCQRQLTPIYGTPLADRSPLTGGASPNLCNLTVVAYGRPRPQGSKVRNRYGGVRDDNAEKLRPWRQSVAYAALQALDGRPRIEGPVAVDVCFTFDRPKSAPRSRRVWPITRSSGDLDKLLRAVLDAMTDAGAWRDDSQVVRLTVRAVSG